MSFLLVRYGKILEVEKGKKTRQECGHGCRGGWGGKGLQVALAKVTIMYKDFQTQRVLSYVLWPKGV